MKMIEVIIEYDENYPVMYLYKNIDGNCDWTIGKKGITKLPLSLYNKLCKAKKIIKETEEEIKEYREKNPQNTRYTREVK